MMLEQSSCRCLSVFRTIHMMVDVQRLNVDFLVASSHKMCGPTGIGFLYGKMDLLPSMHPFLAGGRVGTDGQAVELFIKKQSWSSRSRSFSPRRGRPPVRRGSSSSYSDSPSPRKVSRFEVNESQSKKAFERKRH